MSSPGASRQKTGKFGQHCLGRPPTARRATAPERGKAFFLFGPAAARFSFWGAKKRMGGGVHCRTPANSPSNGRTHSTNHDRKDPKLCMLQSSAPAWPAASAPGSCAAGHCCHPPGDEAGEKDPRPRDGELRELCCSNSLRSDQLENAVGLLKEELRRLGSLILACADATRVEAGGALAVDRHGFARMVTEKLRSHPNITVVPGECHRHPGGGGGGRLGPLTSDALAEAAPGPAGGGHRPPLLRRGGPPGERRERGHGPRLVRLPVTLR